MGTQALHNVGAVVLNSAPHCGDAALAAWKMWGMSISQPNPFTSGFVQQVEQVHNELKPAVDTECTQRYCEACDREFTSQTDFAAHVAAHVPCPVRGCNFQGARRVVNIHVEEAHSSSKKGVVSDTPEDIARWIAERKKNFPSRANIERKEKEAQEKAQQKAQEKPADTPGANKRKNPDSDQQGARSTKLCRKFASSGRCRYGEKCHFVHAPRPCHNFAKGRCKHGDKCKFSHNKSDPQSQQPKSKPSLLAKLLSSEIESERTMILQCLRHLVRSNFFLDSKLE